MEERKIKILLVEDNDGDARLLKEILRESNRREFQVERAARLAEGLDVLATSGADVILLDLMLPDSYGIETVQRTRSAASDIPIVVLTGLADEEFGIEAMHHGAQDYLVKGGLSAPLLVRTIRYAIERQRLVIEVNRLALSDSLTGLHNRRGFMALAEQQISIALRTRSLMMLLFVDLDGLKGINDGFGHQEGDSAIAAMAQILKSTFRVSDIVARVGGDEFLVLTLEVSKGCESSMLPRLMQNIERYNLEHQSAYSLSCSVGTACFYPNDPVSLEDLIAKADHALYVTKHYRYSGN